MRPALIWTALSLAGALPLLGAALSPQLAWRDPVYVFAGFAGIVGMVLLLVQPLLALAALPGLDAARSRRWHRASGLLLVTAIVLHVAGLWFTSPPDVVDALLFVSPTPFSDWGVIAMWAVFATACLALGWRRIGLRWITWARLHRLLAALIAATTIVHVALIDGTMDPVSKLGLSALVVGATAMVVAQKRVWRR